VGCNPVQEIVKQAYFSMNKNIELCKTCHNQSAKFAPEPIIGHLHKRIAENLVGYAENSNIMKRSTEFGIDPIFSKLSKECKLPKKREYL